jgi:excisionase family DNA binding protein
MVAKSIPTIDTVLRDLVRLIVHEELAAAGASRALSVAEAARRLGIGRSALYAAIARGEVASVRIGRRRLIPEAEVARLLGRRE